MTDRLRRDPYRDLMAAIGMQPERAVHLIGAIERGDHEQEAEIARLKEENETLKEEQIAFVRALEEAQAGSREEAVAIMQSTYGHRGLARMALDNADEVDRLRAENERLREAFAELLEEAKDMRSYVPDYFAKKWKHDEALSAAESALGSDDERRAHDELHGCWECGTSDMRGNVCAEHESGRRPSRDSDAPNGEETA